MEGRRTETREGLEEEKIRRELLEKISKTKREVKKIKQKIVGKFKEKKYMYDGFGVWTQVTID